MSYTKEDNRYRYVKTRCRIPTYLWEYFQIRDLRNGSEGEERFSDLHVYRFVFLGRYKGKNINLH